MDENINFYKFIHKQIVVVIVLFMLTSPGYLFMGYIYSSLEIELLWFALLLFISLIGYRLHREFSENMALYDKQRWLKRVQYFMFSYFSLWSIMFLYYITKDALAFHYIAIATQFGSAVVAATILASQKRLVISTVITLMLPLALFFFLIDEIYGYLLTFFTMMLTGVLLYAAKNTHNYLLKSRYQAYHDHLTSLGNRRYFTTLLENSIKQNREKYSYILLIDLDYFKTINDTLGHDVGDALLCEVSSRMKRLCSIYNNNIARLGGDEFSILSSPFLHKKNALSEAKIFAQELLLELKQNYLIEGNKLFISASIGVSIINNSKLNAVEFLKEADIAMYEAKSQGRDGIIIFNEELSALIEKRLDIELFLQSAIEKREIYLNYQPQVDAEDNIVGCEVLVRWSSEKLGFVGPDIFIPIAEKTGYIIYLGAYILEESFKSIVDWHQKGLRLNQISINISMRQLLHSEFKDMVVDFLNRYRVDMCDTKIIFEITESSTTEDLGQLIKIINELKKHNISFSMDDFGTGYSSLSYLREIPVDELKIDKSFISALEDAHQALLVKTIIDIAKNLNLSIVAEGVEEEYQRAYLSRLDCDLYQGYLFSKPLPKEGFEKLLLK